MSIMAISMGMGGLMWGGLCIYLEFFAASTIPFGYTLFTSLNFIYFHRSKNFRIVRFIQVLMSLLLPFIFQVMLGGATQTGGVMLWAFLALIGSMTFQNIKQSVIWMSLYLCFAMIVGYSDKSLMPVAVHSNHEFRSFLLLINIISISIGIFWLLIYFVNSRERANRELLELNKQLETKVSIRTAEITHSNQKLEESINKLSILAGQLEEKNRSITDSLNYAQCIQSAILTNEEYMCFDEENQFVLLKPKAIVSGDFYWSHYDSNEKTAVISVVDCTGHGVPGALMSLVGNNLLKSIVVDHGIRNPKQILEQMDLGVNRILKQKQKQGRDGMDMALVVINFDKMTLEFSGANSPVVLISDGEIEYLKGDYFPIGGLANEKKEFQNKTVAIKPDGMLYLFSDGYADQFGGELNKKYMLSRFRNLLLRVSELTIKEQKAALEQELSNWQGQESQTDDILIVGIRISDVPDSSSISLRSLTFKL